MATIQIDVKDNASKPLKKIEKAADDVDQSLEEVEAQSDKTSKSFSKMGLTIAAVAAALGTAATKAIEVDRAMFGLDDATKKYIRSASEMYGINETLIGQWTRTMTSAGLAKDEIASLMDTAVALGRLYPNESTEEFVDNLREFVRTGEDAGYITDVLESHFRTTKLETISFSDKMKALKEITEGVNAEFAKTKAGRFDKTINDISNAFNDLGTALWDFADESGVLWLVTKALQALELVMRGVVTGLYGFGIAIRWALGKDTDDAVKAFTDSLTKLGAAKDRLFGTGDEITLDAIDVTARPLGSGGVSDTVVSSTKSNYKELEKEQTDYERFMEGSMSTIERGMVDMFRSWQDGALDFKEFMRNMLNEIAAQIFEILFLQQMIKGFSSGGGGLDSILGLFSQGGVMKNGVQKFASGGVVSAPTVFPMANGMGLMGEAGAEAIMPLSRMSNGNLGVESNQAPVSVNVNNYGNDDVSVTQDGDNINIIISQVAAQISRGTGDVGTAMESRYGLRKV